MQLQIIGKQIDVGEALRHYVHDRVLEIREKYFVSAIDSIITFSREAHLFRADIQIHAGRNIVLNSSAEADEIYVAFDQAAERIARRLSRYRDRLRTHHRQRGEAVEGSDLAAASYVVDAQAAEHPEGQPVIIAESPTLIETLSPGEAVMRMDLAELPALLFRHAGHGRLNMVYRRGDGNIGWVDPATT